jgi:hypothetical protein
MSTSWWCWTTEVACLSRCCRANRARPLRCSSTWWAKSGSRSTPRHHRRLSRASPLIARPCSARCGGWGGEGRTSSHRLSVRRFAPCGPARSPAASSSASARARAPRPVLSGMPSSPPSPGWASSFIGLRWPVSRARSGGAAGHAHRFPDRARECYGRARARPGRRGAAQRIRGHRGHWRPLRVDARSSEAGTARHDLPVAPAPGPVSPRPASAPPRPGRPRATSLAGAAGVARPLPSAPQASGSERAWWEPGRWLFKWTAGLALMLAGSGLLLVGGLIRRRRPRATTAAAGAAPPPGRQTAGSSSWPPPAALNGRLAAPAPARSRRLAGTD